MKLKLALVAIMLTSYLAASAQLYKEDYIINRNSAQSSPIDMIYGVMVGSILPVLSDKDDLLDISNAAGFQAGIMWGVDLGGFEIIPEIWYQHNTTKIGQNDSCDAGKVTSNAIEVPIILAIELGGGVRFNFGPSLSLMSNSQFVADSKNDESYDFGRTKSTAGYLVGVSVTLADHFIIDGRYTGRFVSTSNDVYLGGNTEHYDYRHYSFGVNIGYRF